MDCVGGSDPFLGYVLLAGAHIGIFTHFVVMSKYLLSCNRVVSCPGDKQKDVEEN